MDGMLIYNSQYYEQYPGLPIELPLVTAHHRADEKSDSRWGCLSTLSCLLSIPLHQTTECFPDAELTLYIYTYILCKVGESICLGFGVQNLKQLRCCIESMYY
jgi:hypothetical protein